MHPADGRVVSNFITQALAGKDMTVYGDGSQTRAFCYVDDMIDALLGMMDGRRLCQPINLGSREEISMLEIARQIIAASDAQVRIVFPAPARRRPATALSRYLGRAGAAGLVVLHAAGAGTGAYRALFRQAPGRSGQGRQERGARGTARPDFARGRRHRLKNCDPGHATPALSQPNVQGAKDARPACPLLKNG